MAAESPFFVAFATPKAMLAAKPTSLATLVGDVATCTVGSSERLSSIATTIALAWTSEEYVRLTSTHSSGVPCGAA